MTTSPSAIGSRASGPWWKVEDQPSAGLPGLASSYRPERAPGHAARRPVRRDRRHAPPAASHPLLYAVLGLGLGLAISSALVGSGWWLLH